MNVQTTALEIAKKYRLRGARLAGAEARTLKRWAADIDRHQVVNLSGTGEPGSYPVPVRTGNLRGSHFFRALDRFAVVGNTARYAAAIHSGELITRDGTRYAVQPRPYLDSAAEAVDGAAILADEMHKAWAV